VAYLEICRNPDNRTNSKVNCKWCVLPLMQQTLTKYNGSSTVIDVQQVVSWYKYSLFLRVQSIASRPSEEARYMNFSTEVSTIYMLDLQSYTRFRRNLVFGANLILVYIDILQSLLYLTFTAFGLRQCYTCYPWTWTEKLSRNVDNQLATQPTLRNISEEGGRLKCNTTPIQLQTIPPPCHRSVTVHAYLGLR
jgi:hypothetical protein